MAKESEIISSLRRKTRPVDDVIVGIGDDAAVIKHRGATDLLACCDVSVEGVHFQMDWTTPKLLGRKSLAVTLSDVAAMGGVPRFALVSLALPQTSQERLAEEIMQGIFELADDSGVTVIGGDTSGSRDSLFIDTSVIGECAKGQAITRGQAKADDLIFVTGSLGASALGLLLLEQGYRWAEAVDGNSSPPHLQEAAKDALAAMRQQAMKKHLIPEPRLLFGKAIGELGLATAMIDVSDGLSTDLAHILEESNCGATLRAELLPIANCVRKLSRVMPEINLLNLALHSGEEYELLFTAPGDNQRAIVEVAAAINLPVIAIGRITRGRQSHLERGGKVELMLPSGYEHTI
jgi:thiamine-monophosphate kinase